MSIEWRIILAIGLLLVVGCGAPQPCTITGKVLVDGRPAEGVYLVFETKFDATAPPETGTARSESDGSFSLYLSHPGESTVTAFWPTVTVKDQDTIEGADRFRGVYRNQKSPVAKLTIHDGENELTPISIKSPPAVKKRALGRG